MALRRCVLVTMFAAACGGSSGGPIGIQQLQAAEVAELCNLAVRCRLVSDAATCEKATLPVDANANLVAAVLAGTVKYDGNAAAECLAAEFASCDRSELEGGRSQPESCYETFTGTVADGGTCSTDVPEECISQDCVPPPTGCTMACCQGTCSGSTAPVRPTVGQSCAMSSNCVDSYCDSTQTCAAFLVAGASCTSSDQCAVGLVCRASDQTCQPLAATGGTCMTDTDCASVGDYCGGGKCTAYGLLGAPCSSTAMCSPFYRCDTTTSACVLGPKLGETCMSTGSNLDCIDGSYCDPQTLKCTALLPDGAQCTSSSQCVHDNCDLTTSPGTCMTPATCI